MNKADLTKQVYKVIPVNCNGRPDCDGGLAGALWKINPQESRAYSSNTDVIEREGFYISDECVFIDTMRGLDVLESALIEIGYQNSMILLMPPIGCGIAGYSWDNDILPLIEKYLQNHDVIFVDK